jgi:tetratricopeptide (TPR) repeat protein
VTDRRQIATLLEQAEVQRRLGNHRGATDLARRALTLDPDHAVAHAALASILLDARRLAGAGVEVRAALALDSNDGYIHRIAAAVMIAERRLGDAWAHCLIALQAPAPAPEAFVLGARVRALQGEPGHARELLEEALAIDAAHTGALTQLALQSDPGDRTAHTVAGFVDLARGDATGAEGHARFVLHSNATDHDGLALWMAIQARRSWLLGAWWRWNAWLTLGDDRRRLALLMAAYLVAQSAIIVTDELGLSSVTAALMLGWLGFCIYTWFSPALFRRKLARSLEAVRLDPEF